MTTDAEQFLATHGFQDMGETKHIPKLRRFFRSIGVIDIVIKVPHEANLEDVLLGLYEAGKNDGRYDYQHRVHQAWENLKAVCAPPVLEKPPVVPQT